MVGYHIERLYHCYASVEGLTVVSGDDRQCNPPEKQNANSEVWRMAFLLLQFFLIEVEDIEWLKLAREV